jgi:hypothetical protein
VVFLTLSTFEDDAHRDAQIHFVRPRGMKHAHIFKILIHIGVVEDLSFYHFPHEELLADGKVSWQEFTWFPGCLDGKVVEEEFNPYPRFCAPSSEPRWRPNDVEDQDREHKRDRSRGLMQKVSTWIDNRGRSKNRSNTDGRHGGWLVGESSRGRNVSGRASLPPTRNSPPADEHRAMQRLWQEKGMVAETAQTSVHQEGCTQAAPSDHHRGSSLDIIEITPIDTSCFFEELHRGNVHATPEVITIIPQERSLQEIQVDVQTSGPLQVPDGGPPSSMEIRQEAEPVNQKPQKEGKETSQTLQPAIPDDHTDSVCNSYCGLDLFDANKMCKKIGIGNARNKLVDIKYF